MKAASAWSTHSDVFAAAAGAYRSLTEKLKEAPTMLFAHCSTAYDVESVRKVLNELAPGVPIHGSTSCLGVMTEEGFHSNDGVGLGLFGLLDPEGSYGVGLAPLSDDSHASAQRALDQALRRAQKPGTTPSLVWISAAPGSEEQVIAGIEAYLGAKVPIAGGSAADNEVAGGWELFTRDEVSAQAVVISALFPSSDVVFSFHSGYEPTAQHGKVTRAEQRIVYEIDGRSAVRVYDEWTGGTLKEHLAAPGNVLANTTLYPLGREVGAVGGVPSYQLSHPNEVRADGGLTLFTEVTADDKVVLMRGTHESLVTRAGRVARAALDTNDQNASHVAGALIIYCAGCMLTVKERMNEVAQGLRAAIGEKPFLTTFTFGEQGCFVGGENRHGNLMISVLLFMKD